MSKGNVSFFFATISHVLGNEVQRPFRKNYVPVNNMRAHFQGLSNGVTLYHSIFCVGKYK